MSGTIYSKKMNSPYIYIIENRINGHKYVGKCSSNMKNYFGSGVALADAIKKYGKHNFEKIIVEYCKIEDLNQKEIEWIEKLDTYNGVGYNLTPGGEGWTKGMRHSEGTLSKFKDNPSQKGKVRSEETKQKIRDSLKVYRDSLTEEERKSIYGKSGAKLKGIKKHFSEEHKKNLSLGQKGKPKSKRTSEHKEKIAAKKRKKVIMIDKNDNILNIYNSIKEAEFDSKILSSCISAACSGKQKTAGGFKWKFYE